MLKSLRIKNNMVTDNTVEFYDQESEQYSKKRYEGETLSYFQFLFKRRRQLFLDLISRIKAELANSDVLEIGCADGVLIKKLFQKLPDTFRSIVGIDVSPAMLNQARQTTRDLKASYFLRGEEPEGKFNLVIELGVHPHHFEDEMIFVSEKLESRGYFIYSASGKSSLHVKIKLGKESYTKDYLDYSSYEKIIKKYFDIVFSEPYGLFIPKVWAIPSIARVLQPFLEIIFKNIFPDLFHEKIYLLRKRP